jgi:hypothetical protein
MTLREKRRLLRAFAVAYELAYRRGFHHGYVCRREYPSVTEMAIIRWRASRVQMRPTPPPPDRYREIGILDRMEIEAREHGRVIREFASDVRHLFP